MRRRTASVRSPVMACVMRICSLSAVTLLWPCALRAQEAPAKAAPDFLHELSDSFQTLARKVSPSVVQILVTSYGPLPEARKEEAALIGKQHVTGSGAVLDPDGYIITNAHVVAGAQRVRVVLSPASSGSPNAVLRSSGRVLDAKIVGQDREMDLALLKIAATGLPALPLGDYYKLRQGQVVLAFGSPEGLENSVTMGVISSVARQANLERPMIYIQTDAPINPGNSGGPLVDVDGNLVGINTFILTQGGGSEGLGFAIPSVVVRYAYPQLKAHGHVHRGHIGAAVQAITPVIAAALELPRDHGVIVTDVLPGGPADSAGLKIQDVVVAVNDRLIATLPQFQALLILHTMGESLKVDVLRDSEKLTLQIPVIQRKDELDRMVDLADAEKNMVPKLGIMGLQLDEKLSQAIPGIRFASGVVVAALTATGPAAEIGLLPGDIIHSLNRLPIVSVEALQSAFDGLKPGAPVVLQVERGGELQYVAFEME